MRARRSAKQLPATRHGSASRAAARVRGRSVPGRSWGNTLILYLVRLYLVPARDGPALRLWLGAVALIPDDCPWGAPARRGAAAANAVSVEARFRAVSPRGQLNGWGRVRPVTRGSFQTAHLQGVLCGGEFGSGSVM